MEKCEGDEVRSTNDEVRMTMNQIEHPEPDS